MNSLVVEDNITNRIILEEILKQYGPVHTAVNGKEAVEAVRLSLEERKQYDLICLDIMMPEMDGHEALRAIRSLEEKQGIFSSDGAKIVMVTALGDIASVSSAFSDLCDDYMTKPIDPDKVETTLRKLNLIR